MIASLKKIGQITLISFLGFVAIYTLFMGLFFSLTGMWLYETKLMLGYTATFIVSALSTFLLIRKDF